MNKILIILLSLVLVGCTSNIKNPRLSLGKKCMTKQNDVVYSYVWIYDKDMGLTPSKKQCV